MWIPFKKILQAKKAIYISLKAKKKSKSKWDQLREKKNLNPHGKIYILY